MKTLSILLFCIGLLFPVAGQGSTGATDEVVTTVEKALGQYSGGDFDGAASNLDYAAQLVRQKKKALLQEAFPTPLAGWLTEPPSDQTSGTNVFGGSVSRSYERKPSRVTIEIATDPPVMSSLVVMLNNPVIAGAGGAKIETFGNHKGIVQYNETSRSGEINIVVGEHYLVTVKGQQVDRTELVEYAKAVKYGRLPLKQNGTEKE